MNPTTIAGKFCLSELFTTTQEKDHESGFSNATNQNNDYGDEVKTTTNLFNIAWMSMHTTFNVVECFSLHMPCYYVPMPCNLATHLTNEEQDQLIVNLEQPSSGRVVELLDFMKLYVSSSLFIVAWIQSIAWDDHASCPTSCIQLL